MTWESEEMSKLKATIEAQRSVIVSLRTLLGQSEESYEKLLGEKAHIQTLSDTIEGACEIFLRDQHKAMQICKRAGVDLELCDGELVDSVVALKELLDEERAENEQFRNDIEFYRFELYGEEPPAIPLDTPVEVQEEPTSSSELGWNDATPTAGYQSETALLGGYPGAE